MRKNILAYIVAAIAGCLVCSSTSLQAIIVSDNNLISTDLGSLATTGSPLSVSFSVAGSRNYAVTSVIQSTQTGADQTNYIIAGVSSVANPTIASNMAASLAVRTLGVAYPATANTLLFQTSQAASEYYYNLGLGVLGGASNTYRWNATGITLYGAAGTNGNLAPNASFENSNVSFWSAGGAVVADAGKQGSNVWQITTTTDSHIGLAVVPGQEYLFSFWMAIPTIGNGAQVEYGASVPQNGFGNGAGNTLLNFYVAGGNKGWTEYTGTFTAAADQSTWYLGGMSNVGVLQFDSIYLAAIPEPGTVFILGLAALFFLIRYAGSFRKDRAAC